MNKNMIVSAPGKLVLFGEHAAVYGKPCIVTSVNQRLTLQATFLDEPFFELEAKDVGIFEYKKPISEVGKGPIPKGAIYIETALANLLNNYKIDQGITVKTTSQYKTNFGFGSSSASAICLIKALSELADLNLTQKEIFRFAHKTVLDVAGIGSGIDLASSIYGDTLYFITPGKVIEPLNFKKLPLIVGFTGVKFDTPTLLKQVNMMTKRYPTLYRNIFDEIGMLVDEAKIALKKTDYKTLGELMNFNQGLLDTIGVNSGILSKLIYAARDAGAYGAKLSGAGGGDCMIAIAPDDRRKAVENALSKAGGQVLKVDVNTEGVRVEV